MRTRVLDGVGLGEVEERAYRALLRHPRLLVRELGAALGVPTATARRAAEALTMAGLVTVDDASPPQYAPVDPRIGIPILVRARQAELERATAAIDTYAAEYMERMLRSEPQQLVEVLDGPSIISERLDALLRNAEREVIAFEEPPYVTDVPRSESETEEVLLARGVSVRAVYGAGVLDVPERVDAIRRLSGLGEEARVAAHVPLKMMLIDRRVAVVPLTAREESTRTTAVLVWQSRLCDALVELFEATWEMASPVFADAAPVGDLSGLDSELLRLLSAGLKDETVARHLGLSERTVRRHVAELIDRLGASSRFQAGAQAARRGWV
ncbi:LuxR C-terminal-related transcriptional regulator [Microbacterium sp. KUDC0406]|uniref:helix-turn-helix transcriptional regulator n=1 Tax=Microbacterium sp. KUDC0406 TaxID=2909588 RepID=UPI001F478704|nr:helix-turn-helix domain-containing protein [Microbacterium sp. KUDC0406]UJP09414.1 LuxR C-terminal-related transcriptional regulator [Microbacterium sp. KUDC0406]